MDSKKEEDINLWKVLIAELKSLENISNKKIR